MQTNTESFCLSRNRVKIDFQEKLAESGNEFENNKNALCEAKITASSLRDQLDIDQRQLDAQKARNAQLQKLLARQLAEHEKQLQRGQLEPVFQLELKMVVKNMLIHKTSVHNSQLLMRTTAKQCPFSTISLRMKTSQRPVPVCLD